MGDIFFQIIINIIISTFLYLLVASSFSLAYYPTKFFHLAHAATITFGAYFTFFFINKLSIPFAFSVLLAITAVTLLGMLCEIIVYRPMRKKNATLLAYLIASIGLYVILQNCISVFFGDDTKIINQTQVVVGHNLLGAYITTVQIATIIISVALFVALSLFLRYSNIGRSIRAVANNAGLSDIYGINSNKIILIAFGIGSALAAIAGILSAMDTNMTPTFGFNLLLYGVVVMIIGGVGSTKGLIAGSLLVATAQNLAAYCLDTRWMDAITYIILILFLIWRPLGFSGQRLKKVEV
ncbi:MAG TPA: branched-chain amino acid ABC transporter permease [Mucilaginibacter sp.]|jgi:branched-chain amino acid transport system permease protein|nr:branched-chain amino acid ABC transporter permease [Mucilaginibacter sp.]